MALGDGSKKFIPEIWATKLEDNVHANTVFSQLFNTNYSGDISGKGDTVHIGKISTPTIKDYECDKDIDAPEAIEVEDDTLVIDQGKYFNIGVCDVWEVQSNVDLLNAATAEAGMAFADALDKYLGGLLAAGTVTEGLGTDAAPIALTADNAYATLVKLKIALDKANVPTAGRKVVVPPEFEGLILQAPSAYVRVDSAGENVTYPGAVYRAAGFDILVSNNVTNADGKYKVVATTNASATLAQQITKIETYRPEKRFGDAVKGLYVYGAKVVHADRVAVATVSF